MTGKIFRAIMLAAAGVLLASIVIIMGFLYSYFGMVQTNQLKYELSLAAAGVEAEGIEYLDRLSNRDARLTLIAPDGSVLYDGVAESESMENHAMREEVAQAFENGEGQSERYSNTLMEKNIYCAKRLSDGSVLRISVSSATMGVLVLGTLQPICVVIFISLIIAFFMAKHLSDKIVEPLNSLDLDNPLENNTYDELAPLLTRISRQHRQIQRQLNDLDRKQEEFSKITESMNEGLVLLNENGVIVSINPSAKKLFHAENDVVGREFIAVERNLELDSAITDAKLNGHSELEFERDGQEYKIVLSAIMPEGIVIGVVLLAFNVTQEVQAERTRREFTANVSHELKTPLTSIIASSDMIANGIVKPEDMPRFVGHIKTEATRLLSLIEDIIRLSQLDEGVKMPTETSDIATVVKEVAVQLNEVAEKNEIEINLNTESCVVDGASRLLYEIVYNLVDNAVKYNVKGGKVDVSLTSDGLLTVSDTGIGIPVEHHERIFERFYRVDKSHSKQSGGTGLGLSIVKHAAEYFKAEISLKSEVGKGTTVTVKFNPK